MARRGLIGSGTIVKIDNKELNFVTEVGGLGGSSNGPDITCLKDRERKNGRGLKDIGTPYINYQYDYSDADSDFAVLKAIEEADQPVSVEVIFPPSDGSKFSGMAYVTTFVDGAVTVDGLIMAKAEFSLQGDWKITNEKVGGT